jgi:predicted nucleic acid-binding protein
MDKLFLDTSAFLKLYLAEKGSTWLTNFVTNKDVSISELVLFESSNTLTRLFREGKISQNDAVTLLDQMLQNVKNYTLIPVSTTILIRKVNELGLSLPNSLRLRSLDAIHLATALIVQEATNKVIPNTGFTFVTADAQLVRTAKHFGLTTENPDDHP